MRLHDQRKFSVSFVIAASCLKSYPHQQGTVATNSHSCVLMHQQSNRLSVAGLFNAKTGQCSGSVFGEA